jgi:hypothetical protein
LQSELERDIVKDFEHGFTQEGILVGNIGQLASACLVIDILGDDVRYIIDKQVQRYARESTGI